MWRVLGAAAARKFKPKTPLTTCRLTCTRFSSSRMDFDNLATSFKPIVDSLVDAGIIADDNMTVIVERQYVWAPAKRGVGFVRIRVESLE